MSPDRTEAALRLRRARHVVAFTGAGISAESGVPTFRGPQGLWKNYRPEDLANPIAFERDPELVWEWYRWRQSIVQGCEPNAGHRALVDLAGKVARTSLITQNIDGLHERAGSSPVVELHGNIWKTRCTKEGTVRPFQGELRCQCGAWLRPHIVWFGEALDRATLEDAFQAARTCDVLLAVGTSALVAPANMLPLLARSAGGTVIEVNLEPTPLTAQADFFLKGPAGEVLPELVRRAFPS
ncbi:MAG: NAD-dependent deacylase [Candidatus Eremiobacterota bacterium]